MTAPPVWTPVEDPPMPEPETLRDPRLDTEGYLIEPEQWDEALAEAIARAQGLVLEDDHWFVIRFMREYQAEHRLSPDARHAMKHLEQRHPGQGRKRLFELFPYGYVAQACRVAGMKRPRAWSTG
jgi:TusE/DsrC/DsvC family sulfur relay protein